MKNKLFVGGISWGVDDEALRHHFAQYGTVVDARVIRDRETGRSRGFGFVTYESADDAAVARQELDGSEHEGRTIRVNEAEERRSPRHGGGGYGGGGGGGGWQPRSGAGSQRYERYRDHR